MRKTLLIFGALLCFVFLANAAEPIKVTFEDAEIGSKGGVVSVYPPEGDFAIEVVANTFTTGNSSSKVLRVPNAGYRGLYFENIAIPAGAETLYSAIKVKYLVVSGSDVNYPSLELYSSPNSSTMGDTEIFGLLAWAGLWGEAEIGVWKTAQFSLADADVTPIPGGNLILKLVKGDCEYLIDDIELVPVDDTPPSAMLDFESDAVGKTYGGVVWSADDFSATVVANPSGTGNALHFKGNNWGTYPRFPVTLPDGKTVGDIEKISFSIYFNAIDPPKEFPQNKYKKIDYFVGGPGVGFSPAVPSGTTDENIIVDEPLSQWIIKSFTLSSDLAPEVKSLTSFDLAFGMNDNQTDYYLDNITFAFVPTGLNDISDSKIYFNNNTLHLSKAGNVEIYDINGRLISSKVNVSTVDFGAFAHGVYIAKAIIEGKKQVVKFVR